MLLEAFKNVDQYTMMSLCDVICQGFQTFKDKLYELARNVAPILIKQYKATGEEQINTITSLIGKTLIFWRQIGVIECLTCVSNILATKIEPFAKDIIIRSMEIVTYIMRPSGDTEIISVTSSISLYVFSIRSPI